MIKLENILGVLHKGNFHVPKGMIITGTFSADTHGQIAGTVNGDIYVKGKIIVLKDAVIRGDITAIEILIYGRITGDVKCIGKTMVQSGAYIKGNIITSEIHIEKDAFVEGIITKKGIENPAEENTEATEDEKAMILPLRRKEDTESQTWF